MDVGVRQERRYQSRSRERRGARDPLPGEVGHTYGIALDSKGRAWYTKYNENVFGMVEPDTGKVTEKTLPRPSSAPHRMTIDGHDRLWIPLSGYGVLAKYDIAADKLEEIPLPEPDTFPYAARYDAASDSVWVMGNGANSRYRYWPTAARFDTYRLPSPISYGRMIAVDYGRGEVWTSLANYLDQQHRAQHRDPGAGGRPQARAG